MEFKVLTLENKAEATDFELSLLQQVIECEVERELQTWKAPWRAEALDYYLPLGWSFGIWDKAGKLEGYLLGQPFLFMQGLTQVLWVEHLAYRHQAAGEKLVDIAYRWSRDKHLQKVLFNNVPVALSSLLSSSNARALSENLIELKTAKYV